MRRWHGVIGFSLSTESKPDVWTNEIVERTYYGNVETNSRRWQNTQQLNDNLTFSNQISIIADKFAKANLQAMKYIIFEGVKFKISDCQIEWPRLLLSLGDLYTEEETNE